ncbi:gamma-hemolysin subunit A, partial [Staphylococcus aureus]
MIAHLDSPIEETRANTNIENMGHGAEESKSTEDVSSKKWGVTQNVKLDFVKDKKYNKDAVIVKMQGFINSRN